MESDCDSLASLESTLGETAVVVADGVVVVVHALLGSLEYSRTCWKYDVLRRVDHRLLRLVCRRIGERRLPKHVEAAIPRQMKA